MNRRIKQKHASNCFVGTESYREFPVEQQACKWGEKHYGKWGAKYKADTNLLQRVMGDSPFSTASLAPIEQYCGYTYRQINSLLRNTLYCPDPDAYATYRSVIDTLSLALASAPRIPENIVVYRMVCDEFIDMLKQHDRAKEPAFLSTSLLPNVMHGEEGYSGHKSCLKIYVPAGTIGIYVNAVTKRPEQEILIAPNRGLVLLSKPRPHLFSRRGKDEKDIYECQLMNWEY